MVMYLIDLLMMGNMAWVAASADRAGVLSADAALRLRILTSVLPASSGLQERVGARRPSFPATLVEGGRGRKPSVFGSGGRYPDRD